MSDKPSLPPLTTRSEAGLSKQTYWSASTGQRRHFDVSVESGTVYSAFASGYLNPDEAPTDEAFDLRIAVDSDEERMNESVVRA